MEQIRYFEILKKAFLLTWKNKFLWFFGFLVTLGSTPFQFNYNFLQGKNIENETRYADSMQLLVQNKMLIVAILAALLILGIILYLLKVLGSISIVLAANNPKLYSQVKKRNTLIEASKYAWRVVGLDFLLGMGLFITLLLLIMPTVFLFSMGAIIPAVIILIFGILIILPLIVIVFFIRMYSMLNIVLVNNKLRLAVESAYATFILRMKEGLLLGLCNFVVSIIFWSCAMLVIMAIILMGALTGGIMYFFISKVSTIVFAILLAVPLGITLFIIAAFYQTFVQIVWLLFFQEISSIKTEEKKIIEEVAITEAVVSNPESA